MSYRGDDVHPNFMLKPPVGLKIYGANFIGKTFLITLLSTRQK